jgi:hypothetical protein
MHFGYDFYGLQLGSAYGLICPNSACAIAAVGNLFQPTAHAVMP